jgi:hypothetical protein
MLTDHSMSKGRALVAAMVIATALSLVTTIGAA